MIPSRSYERERVEENSQSHTPPLRATPLKEGTFGYKDRREIHSREGGWREATGVVAPRQLFSDA